MRDLLTNQEVQGFLIALLGGVTGVVLAILAVITLWIRLQGKRMKAKSEADDTKIATNTQNIQNQVDAQAIIQADLRRTQTALEEAQKVSAALTEQNRALEKVQISYDSKVDLLTTQMMEALRRDAEKSVRIADLERQKDAQALLITQMQAKQSEMADALGLKDETIRKYEKEIADLRDLQVIDRDEIAKLKAQIDAQQLRLDELEQINKLVAQGKRATNDATTITLAVISNESVPIPDVIPASTTNDKKVQK